MICRCLWIIVAASMTYGRSLSADDFSPPSSDNDSLAAQQDLLILGPLEPLRVRLMIHIDGTPFRRVWHDGFHRLFDSLDSNHDGALTAEQAERFVTLFQRRLGNAPPVKPPTGAMMAAPALTKNEFRYRIEAAAPPILLRRKLASEGAGPALIPLLDSDGDGRLSHDELQKAEKSLHCRDFNDDQLITQQELIAGPSLSNANENAAQDGPVVLLNDSLDAAAVADILLARYDRNRDGMLSLQAPAEILTADEGFATLDADGDHLLTRQELKGFLPLARDAELPFAFGSDIAKRSRGAAHARLRLYRKNDGGYRVYLGTSEVNFKRNNRDPSKDNQLPRMKDFDANNNDSLDADELKNVPDQPEFAILDIDRDGKISAAEFETYFSQRARIAAVQLVLEVSDQGADLFTTLDRNSDRVLSPRELQLAPELIQTEDRDSDGYLSGVEMTYNLSLELSRGGRGELNNPSVVMRTISDPQVRAERQGPAWFQKMDRNRDGDVSPAEFLGSREVFRQLDKDSNGLLSADEAP